MTSGANCTILAGPNGAGKTWLFETFDSPDPFVNADIIAKSINPDAPEKAAARSGREVLRRIADLIARRQNFSYETTLSGSTALNVMRNVRQAQYGIDLIFVVLEDADIHVDRVNQRAKRGGHYIPEEVVRRRYDRSMENLPAAVRLCETVNIYDNTGIEPRHLVSLRGISFEVNRLTETQPLHVRIA